MRSISQKSISGPFIFAIFTTHYTSSFHRQLLLLVTAALLIDVCMQKACEAFCKVERCCPDKSGSVRGAQVGPFLVAADLESIQVGPSYRRAPWILFDFVPYHFGAIS